MEGLVSQKEKFVTLLLVDMIKLTSVPIFQNLIKKQKKQKNVPQVKIFNNLLILVSSSREIGHLTPLDDHFAFSLKCFRRKKKLL